MFDWTGVKHRVSLPLKHSLLRFILHLRTEAGILNTSNKFIRIFNNNSFGGCRHGDVRGHDVIAL